MSDRWPYPPQLPPEQEAIRAKCFHPTGTFVEFPKEEIERAVPERFEQIVRLYPERLAVKTDKNAFTYDELNKTANRMNTLDRVLSEVAALSEAEAQRFLAEKLDGRRGEQQN